MTDPILILAALLAPVLLVGGITIGARFVRRRLNRDVTRLERDVSRFNAKLDKDPQRAGIDLGKRYAANEMQATIDRIRSEER